MSFNVGENIGPYRIVEQLGQGGMATVFKAYHASLDRYVAIKALHPAFNQEPNFEARFQREARVVAKLEHPNIVPVYDYAEHEKRPYLIMKFVEGKTLKARMEQGPLKADEISKIVDAVGSALSYAHKQGVLHRDIKPSNVLLSNDGQIYLADFGLARMAQAGESTLSSDTMLGTPQYISPEQAMGMADLDARTDLYSFGVMLYEMVVGKVPFSADTPFSIIHDHIYSPLPLPRKVNPNVPEPVERVLLKALAKERDDRFEDALSLVEAFKASWNEAGVPIQGSDLSASHVVRASMDDAASPQEEPTKVASAPTRVAGIEKKPEQIESVPEPKKKRSPWMWVSIGLAVVLCLGFLAFARNNRLFARLNSGRPEVSSPIPENNTVPNDPDAANVPNEPPAGPNNPQQQPPPPVEGDVPPALAEAEAFAREHPDDLDARLNLALAYWDADMPMQTFDQLKVLMDQAGPDNKDFYIHAGSQFASHDAWVAAGATYFQAVRSFQREGDVPDDLINQFHEALYKGAERPESAMLLQLDAVAEVDRPMSLIAKARNALFSGRMGQGRTLLDEAKRLDPEMAEVIMLQAEYDMRDGDPMQARNAARELSTNPSIPEWIRIFADEFLKRNP